MKSVLEMLGEFIRKAVYTPIRVLSTLLRELNEEIAALFAQGLRRGGKPQARNFLNWEM